jgi:hypothetical protein
MMLARFVIDFRNMHICTLEKDQISARSNDLKKIAIAHYLSMT